MATQTSREAALARRIALSSSGKSAEKRYSNGANRVRSASEARPSRTHAPATEARSTPVASASPVFAAPSPSSRRAAGSSINLSNSAPRTINRAALSNPSRDLVLARREALSKKGKRADTSRDRTRSEVAAAAPSKPVEASSTSTPASSSLGASEQGSRLATLGLARSGSGGNSRGNNGRPNSKRAAAQHNPSRALVLARREALAKRGKSASTATPSGAAAVRQANPELNSRELAHRIRDLKSKSGAAGVARTGGGSSGSGSTRPSGPRRGKNAQASAAAQDAPWKVGASETSRGQVVTGTQANRSLKTTGNESSTCRTITGTEYLGAEIFRTFCQSDPGPTQPAKVRVSATSHGNRVTGNEVGRSEKVTGDEPGTCKNVTGTEYISANQAAAWCGGNSTSSPSPRKVGFSQTQRGHQVSGVQVGRSEKVTGDEPGSGFQPTGTQYLGEQSAIGGRAPTKVGQVSTLRGTGVTGTIVGRSERVTGNEPGTCKIVTGDEYVGSQQYDSFCGARPEPEAAKVGFSITNRSQVVSGTRTGRSTSVTGDEAGTCQSVTGTPYAGLEQAGNWCTNDDVRAIRQRTPARAGTPGARLSGIQPGIGGVMTGAAKGACESITGTPYIGGDQFASACGTAAAALGLKEPDFPQPLEGQASWQHFSVQSPAQVAQVNRQRAGAVTGTRYETSAKITGPFDLAGDTVTGTEQFRFDRRGPQQLAPSQAHAPVSVDEDARPVSRVTGEGISAGLKITGDDWDRGERVTGTEGVSARRRNPTRNGPLPAQVIHQRKRNEDLPRPTSPVTGSSGNTNQGSLITVSGGARG